MHTWQSSQQDIKAERDFSGKYDRGIFRNSCEPIDGLSGAAKSRNEHT